MTNTHRKIPEYMGRSVSQYGSVHNRGWRKIRDRWLHRRDRQDMKESIIYDSVHNRSTWKGDRRILGKQTREEIKNLNETKIIGGNGRQIDMVFESSNCVRIPKTISTKTEYIDQNINHERHGFNYSTVPDKFYAIMNGLQKYWKNIRDEDKIQIFSNKEISTLFYKEIKNLFFKNGTITDHEFIALCWQYTLFTSEDISVVIKRISRRNSKSKFLK